MKFVTLSFVAFLCSSHFAFAGNFTSGNGTPIRIGSRVCYLYNISAFGMKFEIPGGGEIENIYADNESVQIEGLGNTFLDREDVDPKSTLCVGDFLNYPTEKSLNIRKCFPNSRIRGLEIKHRLRVKFLFLSYPVYRDVYSYNRSFDFLYTPIQRLNELSEGDRVKFTILGFPAAGEIVAIIGPYQIIVKFCKINLLREASELTRIEG